jgi:hypothetical protein
MTAPLLIRHPPNYEAERRYAYRVVMSEFLGIDVECTAEQRQDVQITLADGSSDRCLNVADVLFRTPDADWLGVASLPRRPLARAPIDALGWRSPASNEPLPVLFGEAQLRIDDARGWLGVDVFGSAFFLLTRYEEVVVCERDAHDRFPASASLAAAERMLDRPTVDEYVELLWSVLSRIWPRLRRRRTQAALVLTHDVDLPLCRIPPTEARRLARLDLRRESAPLVAARRLLTARLSERMPPRLDLYNTFDLLMRESESLGLRSSFYFMAGNTAGPIDNDYAIDEPWVLCTLREIFERGHELGLHPSYNTFEDAEALARELTAFRAACARGGIQLDRVGGRQHYLRWGNPVTWQIWDDVGLAYDATLAFADHAGFRAGTCHEYPVFNLKTGRGLNLRERPLIAMDASLLDYQGLGLEATAQEIARLSAVVKRFGGQMTVLWHNDRLLSRRARRAYRAAITAAASPGG